MPIFAVRSFERWRSQCAPYLRSEPAVTPPVQIPDTITPVPPLPYHFKEFRRQPQLGWNPSVEGLPPAVGDQPSIQVVAYYERWSGPLAAHLLRNTAPPPAAEAPPADTPPSWQAVRPWRAWRPQPQLGWNLATPVVVQEGHAWHPPVVWSLQWRRQPQLGWASDTVGPVVPPVTTDQPMPWRPVRPWPHWPVIALFNGSPGYEIPAVGMGDAVATQVQAWFAFRAGAAATRIQGQAVDGEVPVPAGAEERKWRRGLGIWHRSSS